MYKLEVEEIFIEGRYAAQHTFIIVLHCNKRIISNTPTICRFLEISHSTFNDILDEHSAGFLWECSRSSYVFFNEKDATNAKEKLEPFFIASLLGGPMSKKMVV